MAPAASGHYDYHRRCGWKPDRRRRHPQVDGPDLPSEHQPLRRRDDRPGDEHRDRSVDRWNALG
jgi:hypothetical protein